MSRRENRGLITALVIVVSSFVATGAVLAKGGGGHGGGHHGGGHHGGHHGEHHSAHHSHHASHHSHHSSHHHTGHHDGHHDGHHGRWGGYGGYGGGWGGYGGWGYGGLGWGLAGYGLGRNYAPTGGWGNYAADQPISVPLDGSYAGTAYSGAGNYAGNGNYAAGDPNHPANLAGAGPWAGGVHPALLANNGTPFNDMDDEGDEDEDEDSDPSAKPGANQIASNTSAGAASTADSDGDEESEDEDNDIDYRGAIQIALPAADAHVFLNGKLVPGQGAKRLLLTPEIEDEDKPEKFHVLAVWEDNGRPSQREADIQVAAGAGVALNFTKPASTPSAPSPAPGENAARADASPDELAAAEREPSEGASPTQAATEPGEQPAQ